MIYGFYIIWCDSENKVKNRQVYVGTCSELKMVVKKWTDIEKSDYSEGDVFYSQPIFIGEGLMICEEMDNYLIENHPI